MRHEICIHGHFYQPPRDNPWLEEIETQDSAFPYHDWNERIAAECYAPNSASRILDPDNRIINILNNYSRISFNFGPTLLAWLERRQPRLYRSILEADKESRARFSGHGAALAQAYSHMILPLANSRDKRTQILWGLRDFQHRFGRDPEGMWLPETAVDLETLDLLAEAGIAFTILSPRQASRVRGIGDSRWEDVSEGGIDPGRPYLCRLPSGRSIALFFYNGAIAHDVAFGNLLTQGEAFAGRLAAAAGPAADVSRLVHVATDGETFGHHHRFGEMALSSCLHAIENRKDVQLTVYGDYLERNPPRFEVVIKENSSWSCVHGVERWRADCGCRTGGPSEWTQAWRRPLRAALDGLRDSLAGGFESGLIELSADPWAVRDDYIEVILDRSPTSMAAFFRRHGLDRLARGKKIQALKMLEAQRCAQLMYTSCGWFFNDIAGIETVQILSYAARAAQLARELGWIDPEPALLSLLKQAPCNLAACEDGAAVYRRKVLPDRLDFYRVGAHAAISALFPREEKGDEFPAFTIRRYNPEKHDCGRLSLAFGRSRIRSRMTGDGLNIDYGALHLGDQNLMAGIRTEMPPKVFEQARRRLTADFERGDVPAVIEGLNRFFDHPLHSLEHLFRDRKRRVMGELLEAVLADLESTIQPAVERHVPVLDAAREMAVPLPWGKSVLIEFVLTMRLRRLLEEENPDLDGIAQTEEEMRAWEFKADKPALKLVFSGKLVERLTDFAAHPDSLKRLSSLRRLTELVTRLDPALNLWESQNLFDQVTRRSYRSMSDRASRGDEKAQRWIEEIHRLGEYLKIRVD